MSSNSSIDLDINLDDAELKTLLFSNRGFLSKQNEAIRELSKKIENLEGEANILRMNCMMIQDRHQEYSNFEKSLNEICKLIQSAEAKKRTEK